MSKSEKEEILNTINEIKTYIDNIENDINVENSYISQMFDNNYMNYSDIWKKFIKKLIKKIEVKPNVKSILDELINDIVDDTENKLIKKNDDKPKGYIPLDILYFCNKFKIPCYGYDYKMEKFITNSDKENNIKFYYNLSAFAFYFNDNHSYLINDKKMRHSLLVNGSKSNIISLLSNERKIEEKSKAKKNKVDLPFEEWASVENTKIFITQPRLVHDTFYKLIMKGDINNGNVKMSDIEGIVKFQYENKNTIIYNPDYHIVNKLLIY